MHQSCHERLVIVSVDLRALKGESSGHQVLPPCMLKGLLLHSAGVQRMEQWECSSRAVLSGEIPERLAVTMYMHTLSRLN